MATAVSQEILHRASELRYNFRIVNKSPDIVELDAILAINVGISEDGTMSPVSKDLMLDGNIRFEPGIRTDFKYLSSARSPKPGEKAFEGGFGLTIHAGGKGEIKGNPSQLAWIWFQEPMDPNSTTKPEVRISGSHKGYKIGSPQQQFGWDKSTDEVEIEIV